jgi:2-oxoglutarate ferredoxin oxidoreductase subunit alpha
MKELALMKGNEAIAEAAIRAGVDAYFGYPITPQSEVMEYLTLQRPEQRTGMVVLQAESEVASINMIYGAAGTGKKVMTSSSSPGISLMQEGISYIAGAELPCLIVNVVRGGPGLGTIQPSQADYFQAVKGGGHGDYHLIVLAPASVQEMADFVDKAFELAFKYRNPAMILSDGLIQSWVITGKGPERERNIITSLNLDPDLQYEHNLKLQAKYKSMEQDVMFEKIRCDDAEYLLVAYGSSARICQKVVEMARGRGKKIGLLRPQTLFPFPTEEIARMAGRVKAMLSVELSAGQMIEDVKLAVNGRVPVYHYGMMGGKIHSPDDVMGAVEEKFIGGF